MLIFNLIFVVSKLIDVLFFFVQQKLVQVLIMLFDFAYGVRKLLLELGYSFIDMLHKVRHTINQLL